jgi:hypothetical protein
LTGSISGRAAATSSSSTAAWPRSSAWVAAPASRERSLRAVNPAFDLRLPLAAPDGDAELSHDVVERFAVVSCHRCPGGILKPDVVFFGEGVPPDRVARCYEMIDAARVLLVLGSSLTVMSGYRFVIRARQLGTGVAIVNRGPTRGDRDARLKIDAGLADVLPSVVDLLAPPQSRGDAGIGQNATTLRHALGSKTRPTNSTAPVGR